METKSYFYVPLSKKDDFNNAVGHCQAVINILDETDGNFADIVNAMVSEGEIVADEILPIISVVLLDKWNYAVSSVNLVEVCKEPKAFIEEISTWHGVDLILGYHHPDLGFLLINPKNPANTSVIEGFRKNELLNIYIGNEEEIDKKLADTVQKAVLSLLYENKKTKLPASVKSGPFVFESQEPVEDKKPAKKLARKTVSKPSYSYTAETYETPDYLKKDSPTTVAVASKNMSPLVSVLVTNELFHNGNVEAWKRIIRAYNAKYPNAQVMVFYDGERIVDINTLFKWGKVKHGTMIQFAVSDEDIRDLSKLRKYLAQGASPHFDAFLKGSPDTVLNLF